MLKQNERDEITYSSGWFSRGRLPLRLESRPHKGMIEVASNSEPLFRLVHSGRLLGLYKVFLCELLIVLFERINAWTEGLRLTWHTLRTSSM